jgi:hypothetical protein
VPLLLASGQPPPVSLPLRLCRHDGTLPPRPCRTTPRGIVTLDPVCGPVVGREGAVPARARVHVSYPTGGAGKKRESVWLWCDARPRFPGLLLGGAYGLVEGLRMSPGTRLRIRVNSVLNSCGRRGARTANALGVVAIMYSVVEYGLDTVNAERYMNMVVRSDFHVPALALGATAFVYRLPALSTCVAGRGQGMGGGVGVVAEPGACRLAVCAARLLAPGIHPPHSPPFPAGHVLCCAVLCCVVLCCICGAGGGGGKRGACPRCTVPARPGAACAALRAVRSVPAHVFVMVARWVYVVLPVRCVRARAVRFRCRAPLCRANAEGLGVCGRGGGGLLPVVHVGSLPTCPRPPPPSPHHHGLVPLAAGPNAYRFAIPPASMAIVMAGCYIGGAIWNWAGL